MNLPILLLAGALASPIAPPPSSLVPLRTGDTYTAPVPGLFMSVNDAADLAGYCSGRKTAADELKAAMEVASSPPPSTVIAIGGISFLAGIAAVLLYNAITTPAPTKEPPP